ncbi:MAG: hypothetical protein AAB699_01175 [Patescibacteria group bacterium]
MKSLKEVAAACQKLLTKGWKAKKINEEIRFKPPNYHRFCDCPITAIHRNRFRTPPPDFDTEEFGAAAKGLHIPTMLRELIVVAADKSLDEWMTEEEGAARLLFLSKLDLPLDSPLDSPKYLPETLQKRLAEEKRRRREKRIMNT